MKLAFPLYNIYTQVCRTNYWKRTSTWDIEYLEDVQYSLTSGTCTVRRYTSLLI